MPVLRGVSFDIPQGQFVALIGGNGSGKSTVAKLISPLLFAQSGSVVVLGNESISGCEFDIRKNIGFVMQNPDDQIVASIVRNEVAFGPENLGIPVDEVLKRVDEALGMVGLDGFGERETNSLSGGQKQRLALAGAITMRPSILVLDEVTSMLDPESRAEILDLIMRFSAEGMTILMITHHMDEAMKADRVISLDAGCVELDGKPEDVVPNCRIMRELKAKMKQQGEGLISAGRETYDHSDEPNVQESAERLTECLAVQTVRGSRRNATGASDSCETRLVHISPAPQRSLKQGSKRLASEASRVSLLSVTSPDIEPDILECTDMRNPEKALLRFEDVSYVYNKGEAVSEIMAFRDVNLDVYEGDFISIVGSTGSGKSTLIQHMNGLLHPTSGRVLFCGDDLAEKQNANTARMKVGLVFQYPERQLFAATVYDDVAYGPRNMKLSEDEVEQRVREALSQVDLDFDTIKAKSPFHLSGGQQRRVAIAGILAMHPEVLVMDEPCAGLDPLTHFDLMQLIVKLHSDGMTVVMVTHDLDDAAYSTRVIQMKDGRIICS